MPSHRLPPAPLTTQTPARRDSRVSWVPFAIGTLMALTATVRRADLQISDMDRGYYANHSLTLAQHPSETDERLMVRLLAFVLFADERLEFGRGLSNDDEARSVAARLHRRPGAVDRPRPARRKPRAQGLQSLARSGGDRLRRPGHRNLVEEARQRHGPAPQPARDRGSTRRPPRRWVR